MRTFVNISVWGYTIAGILLFVLPKDILPSFYRPVLMGSLALVSALLILLPRLIFRTQDENKKKTLILLQATIALSLFINGIGGLGLYKLYQYGIPYDKFAHFVTPLIFVIGLFYFIRAWFSKNTIGVLVVSSILVLMGGVIWEFLEAFADRVIGTSLLGGGTGGAFWDTFWDTTMNIVGVGVGIFIIRKKLKNNLLSD